MMEPVATTDDPYGPFPWHETMSREYPERWLEDGVELPCCEAGWLPCADGTFIECHVCGVSG